MMKRTYSTGLLIGIWLGLSGFSIGMPFRSTDALDNLVPESLVTVV